MIDSELPDNIETLCENELEDLMKKLGINFFKKTDRKSLFYNHELKFTVNHDFYDPSKDYYIHRNIIKYLLDNNINKLRYYIHIEKLNPGYIYYFRYHIKNK